MHYQKYCYPLFVPIQMHSFSNAISHYFIGRFIAFESRKLMGSQLRWPTHEKEVFTIVHCLKTWRHYLGSLKTKVFTDNISLKYLETKAQATP